MLSSRCRLRRAETAELQVRAQGVEARDGKMAATGAFQHFQVRKKEEKPTKESEQERPMRGGEEEKENTHQESVGVLEANARKKCLREEEQSAPSKAARD